MAMHEYHFAPDIDIINALIAIVEEGLVDEQNAQNIYNVVHATEHLREEVTVAIRHLRANSSATNAQVGQLLAAYFAAAKYCSRNAFEAVARQADG